MAFGWDDALGMVAAPLLGSVFGGGGSREAFPHQEGITQRMAALFDQQMALYNNTNFEALDAATLSKYRSLVSKEAGRYLKGYDGNMLSMGQDPTKFDTEKTRQRGMIAEKAAEQTAGKAAELDQSRPFRKQSLMPNGQILGAASGMAMNMDNTANAMAANQANSIGAFASALSGAIKDLWPKNSPGSTTGTVTPSVSYTSPGNPSNNWFKDTGFTFGAKQPIKSKYGFNIPAMTLRG